MGYSEARCPLVLSTGSRCRKVNKIGYWLTEYRVVGVVVGLVKELDGY